MEINFECRECRKTSLRGALAASKNGPVEKFGTGERLSTAFAPLRHAVEGRLLATTHTSDQTFGPVNEDLPTRLASRTRWLRSRRWNDPIFDRVVLATAG